MEKFSTGQDALKNILKKYIKGCDGMKLSTKLYLTIILSKMIDERNEKRIYMRESTLGLEEYK